MVRLDGSGEHTPATEAEIAAALERAPAEYRPVGVPIAISPELAGDPDQRYREGRGGADES